MDIEAYCDETYPDLFSSNHPHARFLIIGGVWLKREARDRFKADSLTTHAKIKGNPKWVPE
jgi:hypothetical protein